MVIHNLPSPDEFPNMRIPERGKEHSRGYSLEGEAKMSTVWEKGDRVLALGTDLPLRGNH